MLTVDDVVDVVGFRSYRPRARSASPVTSRNWPPWHFRSSTRGGCRAGNADHTGCPSAELLTQVADIACAMRVERLLGADRPYDERIRPHPGQLASAANLRSMLILLVF